jgi:hypothetical protein
VAEKRYSKDEILEALSGDDCSVDDLFLVDGLIMNLSELDGITMPMALIIEDDSLVEECIKFLRKRGVKEFDSWAAFEEWNRTQNLRPKG